VRRSSKRGVVFIREIVLKYAVAVVARFAFNENYSCVPCRIELKPGRWRVVNAEYAWRSGPDRCAIRIETEGSSFLPAEGSASQFITEHVLGLCGRNRAVAASNTKFQHSPWRVWQAKRAVFSGNAAGPMGRDRASFSLIIRIPPSLPNGSPVTVFNKGRDRLIRNSIRGRWVLYDGDCAFCVRRLHSGLRLLYRRRGF